MIAKHGALIAEHCALITKQAVRFRTYISLSLSCYSGCQKSQTIRSLMYQCNVTSKFDKCLIGHFQLLVRIEWFIMSLSNFMCLHFLVKIKYCGRTQLLAMRLCLAILSVCICQCVVCLYSMCVKYCRRAQLLAMGGVFSNFSAAFCRSTPRQPPKLPQPPKRHNLQQPNHPSCCWLPVV